LELRHRNVELSEKNQQQWLYCMETAMCNLEFKEKFIKELLARFSSLINSMLARRSGLDAEC
jgi:truncated hemoglobin YjbI